MSDADIAGINHDFYREREGKDVAAEAASLVQLVRERNPTASSLLDVACGSGSHLERLVHQFDHVEGLDLSEVMLEVARPRLPGVHLHRGDMRDFSLDRRFDAVTCMFGSIPYVGGAVQLRQALACLARHLAPGGVLLVQPWWTPEEFLDRHVAGETVTVGGRTISRVSHATRVGDVSRMEVHWLIADPRSGVRHIAQVHDLTLFERAQYEEAFTAAGCAVELVRPDWSGPGL